jgi:hypothetical protein
MSSLQAIADEVREQNRLFESGDTDKAFWLGQQNRLKAMKALDPSLTQSQIGKMVSKGQQWVQKVLKWDYARGSNPFADANNPSKQGPASAKRVLQNRTQRKAVIDSLSDDEKVALAESVVNTPEMVERMMAKPTKAAKAIRKAAVNVEEREARERFKKTRERADQRKAPTKLGQFFWRMKGQMRDWTRDLKFIYDDLHTLPDELANDLIESHRDLITAAKANLAKLEGSEVKQDDDVIEVEGKVIEIRRELGA